MAEFRLNPMSPYSTYEVLETNQCRHCQLAIGLVNLGKGKPGLQGRVRQWFHASGDRRCERARTYAEPMPKETRKQPF